MSAPTQPYPAPAPTPAPSSTDVSPLTWVYPFRDKDHKDITDPQIIHLALSFMDDGFFPLGVNGFPHGGVHFGNASAARLDQAPGVRCIADGEIVAHRINEAYPHLQFTDGKWAAYSTGFVLVRHRLTMPPAPDSAGPQPADETHDIYSLYMHMADWMKYLADVTLPRPFWWDVTAFAVLGRDHQLPAPEGGPAGAAGAFVWSEPKAGKKQRQYSPGKHVGFLPQGSEVIVGEKRGEWVHIKTITAGAMCSATSGGYFGTEEKNVPWVVPDGIDTDAANTPKPTLTPGNDWGWLRLPNLHPTTEPKDVGQAVIPPTPIQVKAGTLLGQIGEYQDYERANLLPPTPRRSLLHLEVFADDGFGAFLAKCRARAAQLPAEEKTLLVIDTGATLVRTVPPADRKLRLYQSVATAKPTGDSPAKGPWVKVQPRFVNSSALLAADGPPVWIARENLSNPTDITPAWHQFPLTLQNVAGPASGFPVIYSRAQLRALDGQSQAVDDHNVDWWRVKTCTADGNNAYGWVCGTGHPGTRWESPWAWPCFDIVDATEINLADAFKRNLAITDSASWTEKKEFEPSTTSVNSSPLLLKLEQTVAREVPAQKNSEQNSRVTPRAMQASMRVPALAQALSHVILKYESEWGGNMSRWDAITPIMRNARANWLKELERVRKLQWWDHVKGRIPGFPSSATVLHIHPVALVANFLCGCNCINIEEFLCAYEAQHVSFEPGTQPLDTESRENLRILLNGILNYYKQFKNGECNIPYIAYMLATARFETKKYNHDLHKFVYFEPTTEEGPTSYFNRYDPLLADTELRRNAAIHNGNTEQGDGYRYRGRGYVQVTWKNNYRKVGQKVNVDLVANPGRMSETAIAACATVYGMEEGIFTGKKLSDYISDATQDYTGARRIINGQDQAQVIAGFAIKFKFILESAKCLNY